MKRMIVFIFGLMIVCSNQSVGPISSIIAPPVLRLQSDTTVSQSMDCRITVTAKDTTPDGSIELYYWDIGGDGWDDSTHDATCYFSKPDGGKLVVVWGARNNNGLMKTDTFLILFNRIPVKAGFELLPPDSSWENYDYTLMKGDMHIRLFGEDPDGIFDTLSYTLCIGSDSAFWTRQYTGRIPAWTFPNIWSTKRYYWKLCIKDLYGDSLIQSGNFIAPPPPCMVFIPAKDSSFEMGSEKGEPDEKPVHVVTFSNDFYMDATEVRQKHFRDLMSVTYPTEYTFPPWSTATGGVGDDYPVYMCDWHAAALYCNARTKAAGRVDTVYSYSKIWRNPNSGYNLILEDLVIDLTKKGYRLPTEAEWEYACRGGTTTEYYWGNGDINHYAWYASNSDSMAHPVASLLPNNFGLYDMCGNVYEWCNDFYDSTYYASSPSVDPQGPDKRTYAVVRGGGLKRDPTMLRSASRLYYIPGDAEGYQPGYAWDLLGFRVVLPVQKEN